ncbi:MAG: hypothetical protein U0441_12325 [Polyangiaceae bacterium]
MRFPLSLAVIGALVAGALGCSPADTTSGSGPGDCYVDAPCDTDPAKTCKVPCESVKGGGKGGGSGGGSSTGTAGAGGSGGNVPIDVDGITATFVDASFTSTNAYSEAVKIYASDPDGQLVTADATNGTFLLTGVAAGEQWIFAEDQSNGAGQVWSTYTPQVLDAATKLTAPLVTKAVLQDVAIQVNVASVSTGSAHMVLQFVSASSGEPVDGVALAPIAGATFAFDTGGPGQYAVNPAETGALGTAVVFNVTIPSSEADIELGYSHASKAEKATIRVGQGRVTYAVLPVQ